MVLSKLLERLVARQLMGYLSSFDLLPLQSGFRPGHSTENCGVAGTLWHTVAVVRGDVSALVLLDMTAAFDTVNHAILLLRLQLTFDIGDTAHRWFQSYLPGCKQQVRRGSNRSSTTYVVCGVPQVSVLEPFLFVLYIVDLIQLVESDGLSPHRYADDVQVYGSCSPAAVDAFSTKISDCTDDIADWTRSNRLMLKPDKLEAIWCTTSRHQHQLPAVTIPITGVPITPARSVRDLGIYMTQTCRCGRTSNEQCRGASLLFAALRQLRQIRSAVPTATFQTLVVALVHSLLDYGNAVQLASQHTWCADCSPVLNAAARLIYHLRLHDHITDVLATLHWLCVPELVQYKIAVLTSF